jgi:hypothetical protein
MASMDPGSESADRKQGGDPRLAVDQDRQRPAAGKQTRVGADGGASDANLGSPSGGAREPGRDPGQRAGDWEMTAELSSAMGLDDPAGGTPVPGSARSPDAVSDAPPTATYLVPFDRSPLAAPGERVICVAEFTGASAADYEIVYSTVGGHFTSASGPTTRTIPGLTSGNVDFFTPATWNGTDALSVTMKLRKKSDSSTVKSENWTFGKKPFYPTTMTQKEGSAERALPGVYTYDIGPARASGTKPFYQHQTILERFDNWSIENIAPADIKETYRTAHGLTSEAAISAHVIGTYAGDNGTFTVDADDQVADQHGGHPDVETLATNLVAPKEIRVALPQTYEAEPGKALQKYKVTRIRKPDGSWKVKKETR